MEITTSRGYLLMLLLSATFFQGAVGQGTVKVSPREMVVKEGEAIEMLCHVNSKVDFCRITLPNSPDALIIRPSLNVDGLRLIGEGFENGDCGIRINSAKKQHNGQFKCSIAVANVLSEMSGFMNVTIAIPPRKPELNVSPPKRGRTSSYLEGDEITARCIVKSGRPAANLTWYIGDEKLSEGLGHLRQVAPTSQSNPNEGFDIEQTLTRKVQASDNGKELKCVAAHPVFTESMNNAASSKLRVEYAPKEASQQPIELFGLVVGEEGRISVTVMANPRPTFTWLINGKEFHEGDHDEHGKMSIVPGQQSPDMGEGYWDSILILNSLTNEDVNNKYELLASNALGAQKYKVAISTSPEPQMVELGAGAIIGIVVAVLLVLTVAALILFARAKGRWCFAGATAHFAGESSDTESADHHAAHPKIKKTPFTSVFKKKTDKVSLKEPDTAQNTEEEKEEDAVEPTRVTLNTSSPDEGVVYAELDLNLAPGARPPPTVRPEEDKTEYAEIIHTKDNN